MCRHLLSSFSHHPMSSESLGLGGQKVPQTIILHPGSKQVLPCWGAGPISLQAALACSEL